MLSAWGVCLHTASCKGCCLENADMELTIMLLPIKFAGGRTEEVQRRQGFCPWAEEISFLISLISFSWWWLATLWNINPPLYNLPSSYPTLWQSLFFFFFFFWVYISGIMSFASQWQCPMVDIYCGQRGKLFSFWKFSSFNPQMRRIHKD